MKKRLLSILLTLAMVISLFPGMAVTASAAGETVSLSQLEPGTVLDVGTVVINDTGKRGGEITPAMLHETLVAILENSIDYGLVNNADDVKAAVETVLPFSAMGFPYDIVNFNKSDSKVTFMLATIYSAENMEIALGGTEEPGGPTDDPIESYTLTVNADNLVGATYTLAEDTATSRDDELLVTIQANGDYKRQLQAR